MLAITTLLVMEAHLLLAVMYLLLADTELTETTVTLVVMVVLVQAVISTFMEATVQDILTVVVTSQQQMAVELISVAAPQ